jgi:2-polyprenyl-3-methyl-5-hydroxy-6-metoxy-1,4-benzoquinol methylase
MYPADFIACRHVLEHIADPATFLRQIRAWIGNRLDTVIFFEVPNALYVLRSMSIWDFIYEHVTYFTPPALAYLFGHCGFDVQRIADTTKASFSPSKQLRQPTQ